MPAANEVLLDEAVHHAVDLQGYSNGVVRRLIATLNRADARLFAQLSFALANMDPESFTVQRLDLMLQSVRELNAEVYRQFEAAMTQDLRGLSGTEADYHAGLMRSVMPPQINVASVTLEQVYAAAMSRPMQGRLLKEWAASLEADRAARIRDTIRMGYVEGKTTDQLIREVRGTRAKGYADGIIEIDRRNAEAVVRTAVSHTAAAARDEFNGANLDLIKAEVWRSTLDGRTSNACFPGATFALPIGNLLGVSRRLWNGDVVVVTTASGKKLRATPNHPVLTARGWRAMEELQPGADVLYRVSGDVAGVAASEDVQVPATFSAIFDALNEPSVSEVRVESTSEVDFHGDGMAGHHEVNHPRSEGDLRLAFEAAFGKKIAEQLLVFVGVHGRLPSESHAQQVVVGLDLVDVPAKLGAGAIQHRVEGGLADLDHAADVSRFGAGAEHLNDLRFISAACLLATGQRGHNAGAFQNAGDSRCGDSVAAADCRCGIPAGVAPDDVVAVEREFFSGHVFNLSTSTAAYIADGFVVHNCRLRDGKQYTPGDHKPINHALPWGAGPGRYHWQCRSCASVVTKSWKELGGENVPDFTPSQRASLNGQVPADLSYGDWLKKQSAKRQDEVLGPTRGRLLREGGLTMEKFSTDKGVWLDLEQLRERNAAAFKRAGLN